MTSWYLIFVIGAHSFIAGEYQDEERCLRAAEMQSPHWREVYKAKKRLRWRCTTELEG